jgi:Zn-dependent metalloprotease
VLRPDTGTPRLIRGASLERAAGPRAGGDPASETARSFLRKQKALLRMADPDRELVLERRERDRLGRTQLRFGQRHAGLRVWPAERIVHLDPTGDVEAVDGASVATPIGVASEPAVTAQQAIAAARAHVAGAEATVIGPPELLYYTGGGATILAWRVFVPASLRARWWVVVDAATGAIANAWNAVEDTDFVGRAPAA